MVMSVAPPGAKGTMTRIGLLDTAPGLRRPWQKVMPPAARTAKRSRQMPSDHCGLPSRLAQAYTGRPLASPESAYATALMLVRIERQLHRLLALGRKVERLCQHQVAVCFLDGRRSRRQSKRDAVEPRIGLFRHGSAQFAERHVARRVAAHEVDQPAGIGIVSFRLRLGDRKDDVAVRVVDGENPGRADDADLEKNTAPGHVTGSAHEMLR